MSAALALAHVTKRFADADAVADLSLAVEAGSCTAILGPSGSGKTTVLRLIAGLETPDSGSLRIGGRDVAGVPAERRGVGMVFQKSLLFPHLSVLDNVAFAARAAGGSRAASRTRAEEYLDMVQLAGFGARRIGELSGGQEQRVAIARALAAEPSVLLLDEPFSALDPSLRADMHDLIEQVRDAVGPTIVLVTHDRDEASRVADRIALVEGGVLLQEGTVADAYRRPASVRVSELMGGRNRIRGSVSGGVHRSGLGDVPVADATPEGPAVLLVRQEDIRLGVDGTRHVPGEVSATGTVEAVRTSGARTELTVRVTTEISVELDVPSTSAPAPGIRVDLVIPTSAVHVVAG